MARQIQGPETDGMTPRAAHGGSSVGVAIAGLALLIISPMALLAAIGWVFVVVRQVRWHWWESALIGTGVLAGVALIEQLASGNLLAFHFGGYGTALLDDGSWLVAVGRTFPIGLPLGVVAGAAYVGVSEAWAGRAEWHPIEQRRRAVDAVRAEAKVATLLTDPQSAAACSAPPLGVCRGGDLSKWIEGDYIVVPSGQFPAMGLVGESGSGKTVTAERLVTLWARAGRKVFFSDFKGSDPELAARVIAAYKAERPDAACALWPAQPMDMWRGGPVEIANRLLQVQDFTEPFYKSVAETAVRLAVLAPDVDGTGPVRDSATFLRRLDGDYLKRAYEGLPETADVMGIVRTPNALDGVRLRYAGFFAALAGRLDHGFSFEDVDLAVLSVPTLAQPSDAMAVARMVLTDFGAYCLRRKPRIGEDVTFIVDEFSAVTAAAPMVVDLAERVRDVGGQVVVSVQNYDGLGRDDAERRRMRDALVPGGLIVHRLAEPDEVIKPAGTVRAMEQSWQLEASGQTGLGTVKMAHKMRVDPDEVRQARTGEAWVVTQGRAAHMTVIRSRIPEETRRHASCLIENARLQAAELATATKALPQPWWEVAIAAPAPRAMLEVGSLGELVAGEPTPPALPPEPKVIPDPRLLLAIAAYVRAGMIAQAYAVAAETKGLADPQAHVDRLAQRRAAALAAGQSGRRQQRRRW